MPGKAAKVIITERQQQVLQLLTRSSTCPQALACRAQMILLAFDGLDNQTIAQRLGYQRHQVGLWRRRWADHWKRLTLVECCEPDAAFRRALEEVLADAPRPGAPCTFTPEQVTQILAVACEEPEASGRPVSHWTPGELAKEAARRGLVDKISARHVGRFLEGGRTQAAPQSLLAQRRSGGSGGVCGASRGGLCLLPGGATPV